MPLCANYGNKRAIYQLLRVDFLVLTKSWAFSIVALALWNGLPEEVSGGPLCGDF